MTDIEVLHCDDDIIAINKPSGLLSVPGRHEPDSAVSRLQQEYGTILVIHRLDMDTSGIIVFARNKKALANVQRQFENQTTHKAYEALLNGKLTPSQGCVNLPIIVDWPNRPLQKICHSEGRYALTRWQRTGIENGNSRVTLFPKTGRSHQLRIHMQQLGHPILGDTLYAGEAAKLKKRLCLHARELTFSHPDSGIRMELVCPTPF